MRRFRFPEYLAFVAEKAATSPHFRALQDSESEECELMITDRSRCDRDYRVCAGCGSVFSQASLVFFDEVNRQARCRTCAAAVLKRSLMTRLKLQSKSSDGLRLA